MNRIKEVLEEKGIKQTCLAEKIGKSFSQTNAYVCNRRQPSLEQLFEIAKILGVDVKELIDSKKEIDMAKQIKKDKSIEETLWDSANKLRGAVEPSEYKHVVLSLIFLKYASDKFDERRQELIDEGKSAYVDMVDFYTMKSVFYLPPESRWSYIMEQSKQSDIALKIDTALFTIEKNN